MDSVDNRLEAIGLRVNQRGTECWRVERAGPATRGRGASRCDPARSHALWVWLDRLSDRRSAAAYRIRRIAEED